MSVLTISGQIGAGAREVGRLVAGRLNLEYVDQEILVEAARTLGVPVESVVSHDERTAGFGERLATMLRRFLERSAAAGAADPVMGSGGLDLVLARTYGEAAAAEEAPEVSDERYITTLSTIIRDLAVDHNAVIIGRGSQVILKDDPAAVHILLVGPLAARIQYLARREGCSQDEATKRVSELDRGRFDFHHKFFKIDVNDPAVYHMAINTTKFPDDDAAEIIVDLTARIAAWPKAQ